MRYLRIWTALVAMLLLAVACTDAPTGPSADGARASQDVTLDPVIVIGDPNECDPYMDLNWCQGGGECMTSDPGIGDPESAGILGCNDGPGGPPGGGGSPPPPSVPPPPDDPEQPDTCNTGDIVVDAPDVSGQFQELWIESRLKGVELGGWIVSDGSSFRLVPFQNATFTACGIDLYESPPAGTVSLLHTHPWPLFAVTPCGYVNTGTPSAEDVQALQLTGLATGYFIDEQGIGKFTPTSSDNAQRINRCGY